MVARNVAVEIELTQKTKKRLEANIISNGIRYGAQIWIIPKMRVSLSGEIKKQAEMFGYEAYIYHIEEVEEAVRTKVYGGDYSLVHIAPKEVLS